MLKRFSSNRVWRQQAAPRRWHNASASFFGGAFAAGIVCAIVEYGIVSDRRRMKRIVCVFATVGRYWPSLWTVNRNSSGSDENSWHRRRSSG